MRRLLEELVTRAQLVLEVRAVRDYGARAHLCRRLLDGIAQRPAGDQQNQWLAVATIALAAAVDLDPPSQPVPSDSEEPDVR